MTTKQSKADKVSAPAVHPEVPAEGKQPKQVTPPFRALGIPALAAATRHPQKSAPAKRSDLPAYLRELYNS